LTLVLKMRKDQLELALNLSEWTDAHKISGNIYQLTNKVRLKRSETQIKAIYLEFFEHLSKIFWKCDLYLFHTYALYNVQYLTAALKDVAQETRSNTNDSFVLSALSIPLNNKLNNFERLQFNYVPTSMKDFDEVNAMAREELLDTARML